MSNQLFNWSVRYGAWFQRYLPFAIPCDKIVCLSSALTFESQFTSTKP
jgi:hypothetical protein